MYFESVFIGLYAIYRPSQPMKLLFLYLFILKIYIFEDLLILNSLYQKYIASITFKKFINGVLHTLQWVKSVRIWSYSGPNAGNADQNNSEYRHFSGRVNY